MLLLAVSCTKKPPAPAPSLNRYGTGQYTYSDYTPFKNKPITCFYHIPENSDAATPVLIVLPGAGRDAENVRNSLISKANQLDFIVLSLLFPASYYPGSDVYNLANIFDDGDNPSAGTLNPEEEWTFSVIDSLYDDFRLFTGIENSTYDIAGFSAGAQLLHRFMIFNAGASFNRVAVCSAGWYNMPDPAVEFPYGLGSSPMENQNLAPVFARRCYVMVGANDTDPNSASLRHTAEADAQGLNRVERAQYFYQESRQLAIDAALPINWSYQSVPNADHDAELVLRYAADVLY